MERVIEEIPLDLILSELTPERKLRNTNKGDNEIYIVDAHTCPNTMREIGRLRELAFRDGGGGTGLACDIDEFDTMDVPCRQLIVWDPTAQAIIGGYRFILGNDVRIEEGVPRIATSHLFHFSPRFISEILPRSIELGRSFVRLEYQSTKSSPKAIYALDNLWDGLGALTVLHPEIEYCFGKVTMYPQFGADGRDLILGFLHRHFPDPDRMLYPIEPLDSRAAEEEVQQVFSSDCYKENFKTLIHRLRNLGRNVPPLVNAYMSLSPTMRVFGTAVNREFGDVEETGILIKFSDIFEEKKARHIGTYRQLIDSSIEKPEK